ncbi:hypothetical protein [Vibrio coralliilyticus]|uniref:hypothetical protein n=1 Tax=Vibrio coralliilyticus TaxID=190893 RepID=UPI00156080AC|nr:hypothetical protein [Vibrio coralliilyticus]NRF28248.1 hypothetical protein [Vibrio coralliilyticus]NRF51941.1 hypothetical protein [Vibrio coralliilyticus]
MQGDLNDDQIDLEQLQNSTANFIEKMASSSEKASTKSSVVLIGLIGGLIGTIAGMALAPVIGVSVVVLPATLATLGIASGVLMYRGLDTIGLEKAITKNTLVFDEIQRRMNSLPDDAPEEVRDELWKSYIELNSVLNNQTAIALSPTLEEREKLYLPEKTDKQAG